MHNPDPIPSGHPGHPVRTGRPGSNGPSAPARPGGPQDPFAAVAPTGPVGPTDPPVTGAVPGAVTVRAPGGGPAPIPDPVPDPAAVRAFGGAAAGPAGSGAGPRPYGDPPAPAPAPGPRYGADSPAGDALAGYLHARAADFLRGLRLYEESRATGADAEATERAARALRMASRRIGGTLHTFRPLLDPGWADGLRTELAWLAETLTREHACASRLGRLLDALARLSGTAPATAPGAVPVPRHTAPGPAAGRSGALAAGTARAGALLERRLTLAKTRAHSATLDALGSARFHAVADAVALLTSDLPLRPPAAARAGDVLLPVADDAERRLVEAAAALPLGRAGHPYTGDTPFTGLPAEAAQDATWNRVRQLLRLHRYALEVLEALRPGAAPPALNRASGLLDRHRDAAEAAEAAAEAAGTPRIAPATAYALGVLHADQRHEVEAVRFAFQEVWPGSLAVRTRIP